MIIQRCRPGLGGVARGPGSEKTASHLYRTEDDSETVRGGVGI